MNDDNVYYQYINDNVNFLKKESERKVNYFANKVQNSDVLCLTVNTDKLINMTMVKTHVNYGIDRHIAEIDNYDEFISNITKLSPVIRINGYTYKLDCCILANYKSPIHAISAITCNDNYYIINSSGDRETKYFSNEKKIKNMINPCALLPFNWTNTNDVFYIDGNCTVQYKKEVEIDPVFAYNIKKSPAVLIYVKYNDENLRTLSKISDKIKSVTLNKKVYLEALNNIYDLNSLSNDELKTHLRTIYKDDVDELFLKAKHMKSNYNFLYEFLFKVPMNHEQQRNDIIAREFFIGLINKYVKSGSIYKIKNLWDKKFFEDKIKTIITTYGLTNGNIIMFLNGYLKFDFTTLQNINTNKDVIYNKLFYDTDNKRFYDSNLQISIPSTNSFIDYKLISILLKLYIEKFVFKTTRISL
jgi:hypothetical protein